MAGCPRRWYAGAWAWTDSLATASSPRAMHPPPSAVPRPVKGLAAVSFFNDFASEMVYPILPAFITRSLGGGAVILGGLDGAADLTSAVLRWFSGRLADRPGWRKPLILAGYLTAILVRPIISLATSAWQVVGFRVVDRVGKGLRSPARDAMIADLTPVGARGRSFGFHRAADHAGAVAGSLIAWALLRGQAEVRDVIGWSVVPGVVAFLVLAWVLRGVRPSSTASAGSPAPALPLGEPATDATGRQFWLPVVALAGLTALRLPETLLLLFLLDAQVAVAVVPLLWAGVHVVRAVAAYPGGLLSDRLGPRTALRAGSLLYAVLVAWLSVQDSALGATAAFMALGLVTGMIEPAERALVASLAPVRTGSGFGTVQAIGGVAALPAGLAFGSIYQWLGPVVAFLASAGVVAVIALGWRGSRAQ